MTQLNKIKQLIEQNNFSEAEKKIKKFLLYSPENSEWLIILAGLYRSAGRSNEAKKTYSRISVLTQWSCKTKYLFTVPNTAFIPRPKVQSSVVMLKPRLKPLYPAKMVYLQKVLKACFGFKVLF